MRDTAAQINRRNSYNEILEKLGEQEQTCIKGFNMGFKNWYQIEKHFGMNHDSAKRAISNLSAMEVPVRIRGIRQMIRNPKKVLVEDTAIKYDSKTGKSETASFINPETGKTITNYRLMTDEELDRFHKGKQETFF